MLEICHLCLFKSQQFFKIVGGFFVKFGRGLPWHWEQLVRF